MCLFILKRIFMNKEFENIFVVIVWCLIFFQSHFISDAFRFTVVSEQPTDAPGELHSDSHSSGEQAL